MDELTKEEGAAQRRDAPSNICTQTAGNLAEIVAAVNTVTSEIAVIVSAADQQDCGHATIEECAAADLAAMMGQDNASPHSERTPWAAFFLRTREATQCPGTTLVDLPPYGVGGPGATHNTFAVYWAEGHDRKHTYAVIRRIWNFGLMWPNASILVSVRKGLYIALDAGDEQLAAFNAALDRFQWAWPGWLVKAAPFAGGDWSNAERLGCGTHYADELPAPGGAS